MRFIAGLIGRAALLAFGLVCLWYGAQLTGLGSSASDAFDSMRLSSPFHDSRAEQMKVEAAGGVLDDLGAAFGVLALLIGFAAAGCAVFPWSRVFGSKTPETPRPPEPKGSRGPCAEKTVS